MIFIESMTVRSRATSVFLKGHRPRNGSATHHMMPQTILPFETVQYSVPLSGNKVDNQLGGN